MSKKKIVFLSLFIIMLALTACNMPFSSAVTPAAEVTATPTETATPTAQPAACTPTVTTNTDSNVRKGPGQAYDILGVIPQGGTAVVDGKNADASWWYIQFAAGENGHGWIAASITTSTCIPDTLALINPPPAPTAKPSDTPAPVVNDPPSPTATKKFQIDLPIFPLLPSPTPTPKIKIILPPVIKP